MEFTYWLAASDTYMPFLAILVYLILWDKIKWKETEIGFYCIISFILFGITNIMTFKGIHNSFLYHFISLFDVIFVGYYLFKLILKEKFLYPWIFLSVGYIIYWIFNIIFFEPLNTFNNLSSGISNLIILFLCMFYLLGLSTREEILYFQKVPGFWIVSGFLLFSTISLIAYITYTNLIDAEQANQFWAVIIFIANFFKFTLISVGFLCYRHNPSSQLLP